MKKILSGFIRAASFIIGRKNLEKLLVYAAKSMRINLHQHGLLQIGAGTNVYLENGSELFFIKNTLAELFDNKSTPLFFDVGANIGNYTLALKEYIPNAKIYSFEPVKETFEKLKNNVEEHARLHNIGFGNAAGKGLLYNTADSSISEIASVHKEVLTEVFKSADQVVAIEFELDRIDNFCLANNIKNIDFLKIDVEGNELAVLQGASLLLKNNAIKIIQFEFNTHNIYARVFLRDFYLLLTCFEFYRLQQNGMLKLGAYNPVNEIFTAQNIIAVHQSIAKNINSNMYVQYG